MEAIHLGFVVWLDFVVAIWLGFVGQRWCGCVGGDLCSGFWLIWIFGSGCSLLAVVVDCAIDRFVVFFLVVGCIILL